MCYNIDKKAKENKMKKERIIEMLKEHKADAENAGYQKLAAKIQQEIEREQKENNS